MIEVYYSSEINELRQHLINGYITSFSSFEFRKNIIGKITLAHPTVLVDVDILETVTPSAGDFINISFNSVIRFRGRIKKVKKMESDDIFKLEIEDLLQKLNDINVADLGYLAYESGYSSLNSYINSLPHDGYNDFRYGTSGDERYISVRFLLKFLMSLCGIDISNIGYNLSGNSNYIEHTPPGINNVDYSDLAVSWDNFSYCGRKEVGGKGSTCLELMQWLLVSIGAIYEYNEGLIQIYLPGSIPSIPQSDIVDSDYDEITPIEGVEVVTSKLKSTAPLDWTSSDIESASGFYPEEIKDPEKVSLPSFFCIGFIRMNDYRNLYDSDLEHTFGEQLAEKLFGIYNGREATWKQTIDDVNYYGEFWFDVCSYDFANFKKAIEYGGSL